MNHLDKFLELCTTILKAYRDKNSFGKKHDPILSSLTKYKGLLRGTEPEEHADFFLYVYNDHQKAICKGPVMYKEVKWLNEKIYVQFGQGVIKNPDANFRIYLGTIFERAKKMADIAKAQIKEINDETLRQYPEINYPETFLLYLYRVFSFMMPEKERNNIKDSIKMLEELLDINSDEPVQQASNPFAAGGGAGFNFGGLLNGLASSLKGLNMNANQSSGETPEIKEGAGGQLPDIGKIIGTLMSNPKTNDVFNRVTAEANSCKDINDLISVVGKSLQNTELQTILKSVVSEATGNTAESSGEKKAVLPSSSALVAEVVESTNGPQGHKDDNEVKESDKVD